ncbi:MAG: DUF4926 domain-containing protein [Candidatus Poribacteria bacterium]|nr:DUF4926 domain-containing protein [Candidatus Poribacteria bacterium]
MPDLFDVVDLVVDIPERGLRAGMQGTIVECHPNNAYEIEFADEQGETMDFLALYSNQFIVVWRAKTQSPVPIAEQIASLVTKMPKEAGCEVLDFARFLHLQQQQQKRS